MKTHLIKAVLAIFLISMISLTSCGSCFKEARTIVKSQATPSEQVLPIETERSGAYMITEATVDGVVYKESEMKTRDLYIRPNGSLYVTINVPRVFKLDSTSHDITLVGKTISSEGVFTATAEYTAEINFDQCILADQDSTPFKVSLKLVKMNDWSDLKS